MSRMHMMGDGNREPGTPRDRQIFRMVGMTNEHGAMQVFVNADGLVGVLNSAGAVRWMQPANINDIAAAMMPVIG